MAECMAQSLYFDLQADFGVTKHMGGQQATRELAELCHVRQDSRVLEVGCGIGTTSCALALDYGCRVVAVDLSERMVARAAERARKRGVERRVAFVVADARHLPFEQAQFEVVLDESVTAFVGDKQQALAEYVRVASVGGHIGLNEVTWVKTPLVALVEQLLAEPNRCHADALVDAVKGFTTWDAPPEGWPACFMQDSEWAWRRGPAPIAEC